MIRLTHPEKVLYPGDGFTKEDVARYYDAVSEPVIRALRGRPVALEQWQRGIAGPSFYRQNVKLKETADLTTVEVLNRGTGKPARRLVIDRPEALRWLAQYSALTVHMWASRVDRIEEPDWVLFDLDPAEGRGIEQTIEPARALKAALDGLGLASFPKTSGKRGLHVLVPLAPGATYEEAADFAYTIAADLAASLEGVTVDRSRAERRGRLLIDCYQNGYAKTVVAPYSLRGIAGAPVSAPLEWKEVNERLDPRAFTLATMPARLAAVGDLFAPVLGPGARLPRPSRP